MYRISSAIRWSFFPSKTIKKNLDPSYKMDLDLWDYLGRLKWYYITNRTGRVTCSHSTEAKTPSYRQINMVSC